MSDRLPVRIQRKRTRGWTMPEGAIYVGRPTKWGNPCKWSDYPSVRHADGEPVTVSVAVRRRHAVVDFASVVKHGIGCFTPAYPSIEEIKRELAGKDLACWCPPGEPCHADVLLAIANGQEWKP